MSTVIKTGEQNPKLLKRLETLDVSDHVGEARLLVEASRREAKSTLQKAHIEAADLRREAADKGYEAGFRRGYEAGKKAGYDAAFEEASRRHAEEQADLAGAIRTLISELEQRKRDLHIAAQNDVIRFAAKVAEKVTRHAASLNAEAASANLEAALELVESKTNLRVRINQRDLATMEAFAADLKKRFEEVHSIELIADEAVAPGGCIVITPETEVDATIDTQINELAELLVGPERRS